MLRHCHSPRESPRRAQPFLRSPPTLALSLLLVRFFADLFFFSFFLFFPSSLPPSAAAALSLQQFVPWPHLSFIHFLQVIQDYHNGTAESKHTTDWDISGVGEAGILDVTKLGLEELSMRVRVGRNLKQFNLPGLMDQAERIKFESALQPAFDKLIEKYGGKVNSLSPDWGKAEDGSAVANPNLIDEAAYNALVAAHVMFKDMDADPFLKSAGISSDWPYGRGCWQSEDGECIVWFGEEDQLRIMSMKKGTCLNEVFNKLKDLLDTFESIDGIEFATSEKYGYVTSCPSNLGTGMRASVHIKAPNLTKDGQADPHGNSPTCKAICDPLGLSVRGTGGEHTPIGADGTIDLSPRARLFIKESEIVAKLYQGIKDLMAAEKAAGEAAAAAGGAAPAEAEAAPAEAEAAPAEAEATA